MFSDCTGVVTLLPPEFYGVNLVSRFISWTYNESIFIYVYGKWN